MREGQARATPPSFPRQAAAELGAWLKHLLCALRIQQADLLETFATVHTTTPAYIQTMHTTAPAYIQTVAALQDQTCVYLSFWMNWLWAHNSSAQRI